jgi:hypothetical protein
MRHQPRRGLRRATDTVSPQPLPDRHDPARAVLEDVEAVLAEAGYHRAIELLRSAWRDPRRHRIDDGRGVAA